MGPALTLALTAALTCWLLRVSFWRWCRWMALPFGFLLVGVLTILFSVSRDPQMLLASFRLGAFSIGISARAGRGRGDLLAQPRRRWRRRSGWCLICLSPVDYFTQARSRTAAVDGADPADWRFIFILLDEAMAIHRAQTLRFGYGSVPQGYRSLAMLVGLLFTRVLLRYQQMSTALDIKLYQGDFHL